jgi:hypothetical protein
MTPTRARVALVAVSLALILAACSSSSSVTPGASPTSAGGTVVTATPDAAATPAPSMSEPPATEPPATEAPATEAVESPATSEAPPVEASDAPSDAPNASFQLPSTAKDLEALLPNEYGGTKLMKFSMSGAEAAGQSEETAQVLASVGKSLADLSIAGASSQTGDVVFLAVRVAGADEGAMKRVFVASAQQAGEDLQQISLGGRDVFKNASTDGQGGAYFYIRGDTAFGVTAPDDATAAKAIVLLP